MTENTENIEDSEEIESPIEAIPAAPTLESKKDKIFGNKYNEGDLELDFSSKLSIVSSYLGSLDSSYKADEYYRFKNLLEKMSDILEESPYAELLKIKKKIPKNNLSLIFLYVYERIEDNHYSSMEFFFGLGECLDANYAQLYECMPTKIKENILRDVNAELKNVKLGDNKKIF